MARKAEHSVNVPRARRQPIGLSRVAAAAAVGPKVRKDERLIEGRREVHRANRRVYGSLHIHAGCA